MALLDVDELCTEFRSRSTTVRAVDGVSLSVDAGETLAIVGESGCGKSVTALSIVGLLPNRSAVIAGGSVRFDGRDLTELSAREQRAVRGRGISMIFQDPMSSLNPALTIGKQITESLRRNMGMSRKAAADRAVELLALVGIPDPASRIDAYPHQFSGGMRQRAMIAIAIACDPQLILADEITTALDVTIQAQILDLLRSLTSELGTALVMITHDLGVVAGIADRVCVMYAGQVVEQAPVADLYADPRMPYTWGLLSSLPRLDQPRGVPLVPIVGSPPDLADPPTGCRFAARCPYARDICRTNEPALLPVGRGARGDDPQLARCWATQNVDGGGWLADVSWGDAPSHATVTIGGAS
ncbi:MAG: ABC transporter ATP-binding protein [Ilumatobacter fluminis]|uniref:ABC transporter ATP-binding protein n=1 Tax=Ilumatobacter fluminis TaxID=467091 RepID=UPI0032EB264C